MSETLDHEPDDDPFRYYARLRKLRQHLLADIAAPLPASRAAALVGLSANYFSTYFRQRVGLSYTAWAHRVRCGVAQELLRSSDLGVTAVARRVGYRDLRTFERAFKRLTSISARRFRANVRPRPLREARARPGLSAERS